MTPADLRLRGFFFNSRLIDTFFDLIWLLFPLPLQLFLGFLLFFKFLLPLLKLIIRFCHAGIAPLKKLDAKKKAPRNPGAFKCLLETELRF